MTSQNIIKISTFRSLLPAIIIIIFFTSSCSHERKKYQAAEDFILDSFQIDGITTSDEILYLNYMDDTTLYSLDRVGNAAYLYTKGGKSNYHRTKSKDLNNYSNLGVVSFQFNPAKKTFIYADGVSKTFEILDTGFNTLFKSQIHHKLSGLGSRYMFNSTNSAPIMLSGDTILISKCHMNPADYATYISSEHPISKIALAKDSFVYCGEVASFPSQLSQYYNASSLYCKNGNEIALMYPCLDTIYTYDLKNNKPKKVPIHNQDFRQPASFDFSQMRNVKYLNEYNIYNFMYLGIVFNPKTRHHVLFYKCAAKANSDNQSAVPSFSDEPMRALVMDDKFTLLHYFTFEKKYFIASFFVMPDQGIAVPKYSNTISDDKKIVFSIFNF
jgi:hypothetical protein